MLACSQNIQIDGSKGAMSFGRLVGAEQVEAGQTDVVYSLIDRLEDFTIGWEVPLEATFTSLTTTGITVAFGTSCGGLVTATAVSSSFGVTKSLAIPVVVNSAVGDCNDGIDNDCDGLTDCDDTDSCAGYAACACSSNGSSCGADADCCSNKCRGGSIALSIDNKSLSIMTFSLLIMKL
jgi:hypothetical protein